MKLHSVLFALLLSFGSMTHAQSEPSYEATLAFIQEKLNTHRTYSDHTSMQNFVELERCMFAFVQSHSDPEREVFIHLIDPINVDPSRVTVWTPNDGNLQVEINARRSERILPIYYMYNKKKPPFIDPYSRTSCETPERSALYMNPRISALIAIPQTDRMCNDRLAKLDRFSFGGMVAPQNDAPRVVRAMSHLLRICGGREELF